ncbi:RNA-directed DNA polymerase [Thiobacillus sp. 65-1402]|uniref:RNA-directed DNA polymerase n=1 Tax=Thiobacillus sp. 65-1402 TaxID=1895861 RepID=UPI00086CC4A4|nr:RNA-directed DNA polymerase [Thiobacillus sp. 65-1402]ODU01387.1 MAG: hypothetical protein ABS89_07485 [Thiobacillus sp. SCN 63-1177]
MGCYKRWRELGLKAIRDELKADRRVIAVSMDLTSYYHQIDPVFIADKRFLALAKIELSEWEYEFTAAFSDALKLWSDMVVAKLLEMGCDAEKIKVGGLPIGLTISRVTANALLAGLDSDIEEGLAPVYYGRYVDDLFLVLRDPGNLNDASQLLKFIAARTACFPAEGEGEKKNDIYLTLPGEFQGRTTLMLQQTKQKAFFLQGHGGLDLLDNIETQIRSVSSERRLMPSPGRLETMASAKVLTAAGQASEEADTLRRADGLSVRRLGWAIQLRAVETLARDLRQNDWKEERAKFYQFAHSHILRPDKILDHVDYLPRLLSLAVALMDWAEARKLVDATIYSLRELEAKIDGTKVKVNGQPASGVDENAWSSLRASVLELAADAIARSLRWSQRDGGPRPLSETALDLCKLVGLGTNIDEIYALSLALRESDWAKTPYKDHLRRDASRQRSALEQEAQLYGLYVHEGDLHEFLLLSGASDNGSAAVRVNPRCKQIAPDSTAPSLLPYLFPTRPYSTQDISLFLPDQCVFVGEEPNSARAWARYVRAVRGVWVWGSLVTDQFDFGSATPPQHPEQKEKPKGKIAVLGAARKGEKIRLGISSLLTTEDSWRACADGRPDISRERYARIERLINQAISAYPKPTHLLLPELSLPDRWVDTVSGLLLDAGISLVAGLDYHRRFPNWIHSEAVLVLADDRLGFPASVQIRQPKSMPAAAEEERLLKDYGQKWADTLKDVEKPVYQHQGFCFGVLVCSELQNVNHRLRFQGDIDCMIVLSWNQDLETFSALVESASLDVHAHIALVNNRKYGDSRVRSPSKANHGRDLCRLRGGQNEHVVVVELDVETLRAFQSRATRWPRDDDPFKPVPEGYVMAKYRRTTPE